MKSESVACKAWMWRRAPLQVALVAMVGLLSACSATKGYNSAPTAAVPAPPSVVASAPAPVVEEPATRKPSAADMALADGLKAYQAGQYKMAETQLKTALQNGLSAPADVANANKHLAFIYCTTKRDTPCLAAFKAAKAADPAFALSKAEAGHPMWSRTYKKALGLK